MYHYYRSKSIISTHLFCKQIVNTIRDRFKKSRDTAVFGISKQNSGLPKHRVAEALVIKMQ